MYLRDDQSTKRPRVSTNEVTPVTPQGYAPVTNNRDNPPCNTLFIGNLSDTVSKQELEGLFAHQPVGLSSVGGFHQFCGCRRGVVSAGGGFVPTLNAVLWLSGDINSRNLIKHSVYNALGAF